MQEDFWCAVFGLPITSLLKGVAAALVVASVIQSLRAGKYRAAGATLVINAILFGVTPPNYGGAVVLFGLPALHLYFRPTAAAAGRRLRPARGTKVMVLPWPPPSLRRRSPASALAVF